MKTMARLDDSVRHRVSLPSPLRTTHVPDVRRLRSDCPPPARTRHRALFLSDMHLGARASRPDLILRFLAENAAETLYLVGDIADNWHPLAQNWTEVHHRVLRHILGLARTGTRVIYIPGNHDAFFRQYAGTTFSGIEVRLESTHCAADGRSYLVVHGDCADVFARRAPVLARLGSLIETAAHRVDGAQRRVCGLVRASDRTGIERLICNTNAMIRRYDRFEERLSDLARARGQDGIICGHFHQPALHRDHGTIYANCGDWVGSNTALAEAPDGRISLLAMASGADASAVRPDARQTEGELTLAT
jgi:UDP-2,3-diacylglucosamine pyrophosphatase LpxH